MPKIWRTLRSLISKTNACKTGVITDQISAELQQIQNELVASHISPGEILSEVLIDNSGLDGIS